MEKKTRYCLYCNEALQGRSDKQFCNAYCKSAYHNNQPNAAEAYIRKINKQLRQNRSALRTACPLGKATVRKEFLSKLGMNFTHYTHTWKSPKDNLYYFCYDYGYLNLEDSEKVLIIQQQAYMKSEE
ncbi:MAG: hypothetical protein AB7S69_18145 [Salinivirgaceae bacterium]